MITYGGECVYVNGTGVPSLHTIGVSLGRIARFNGHTRDWYPVLGHVLTVANLLGDEAALHGLLHDAPEICCSDVPTPWKTKAARAREARLLKRIYGGLGLKWPINESVEAKVAHADHLALAAEYHVLGGAVPLDGEGRQMRWESPLFSEPDPRAVELTQLHLDLAPNFLRAEVAGPLFEEGFRHYKVLLDAFNDSKREARNAKARERRAAANRSRESVGSEAS